MSRKRRKKNRIHFPFILFVFVIGFVIVNGLNGFLSHKAPADHFDLGRSYLSNAMAQLDDNSNESVSRGTTESRDGFPQEEIMDNEGSDFHWLVQRFLDTALPVTEGMHLAEVNEDGNNQATIVLSDGSEQIGEPVQGNETLTQAQTMPEVIANATVTGAVLIYHTHSTEAYQPYIEGNFHSIEEEGTVREVGAVLEKELKTKGITVYHDKTLHDSPSYNNSYARSLDTLKRQLNARPEIAFVIDLHRDASSYSGKKYPTISVNGNVASSFNIVVGNKNENYPQLLAFANQFLNTANNLYPGIGGKIIEREYKFNGFLSNHTLLLEVGNNDNTIDEVKCTAEAMAKVVEEVMKTF